MPGRGVVVADVRADRVLRQLDTAGAAAAAAAGGDAIAVTFARPGATAVVARAGGSVVLWDLATGRPVRELPGNGERPISVTRVSDGAGAGRADRALSLWDLGSGARTHLADADRIAVVLPLAASADGLLAVTTDRHLLVLDGLKLVDAGRVSGVDGDGAITATAGVGADGRVVMFAGRGGSV